MIEFKEYANRIKEQYQIETPSFYEDFVHFLVDNDWFHIQPVWIGEKMMINSKDFIPIQEYIEKYFSFKDMDSEDKCAELLEMLDAHFPDTTVKLTEFFDLNNIPKEIAYHLTGFIVKFIRKDICLMTDEEVQLLLNNAFEELSKQYGDILTFFLSWLKEHYKTKYINDYIMTKRTECSNEAYDIDEYLELLYRLFNETYILENEMYEAAARSKNYVDTWLFLALHFICALRNSDIIRIHHPRLTMKPQEVLDQVADGTFSEKDARLTLYSVTWRLSVLPLTPNKTKHHTGIPYIKLCIPESVEVHMGTLFALAEAHRQLNGISDDEPLIRIISNYDRISRYMGDEIGILFLESNFKSKAANKSYLQSVFMLTDEILENDDDLHTKGYILAALARSHKGSFGSFASTTAIYLKDAKLSGLTPEFVARELFERGVLSFIPSMLLNMLTNGEYGKLPVNKQTQLIQAIDLSPAEIEQIVRISLLTQKQSATWIKELFQSTNATHHDILQILHRIGNGYAVSKQNECLCLITAMQKICPFMGRSNCIGCKYEISIKSTVFLIISEYNRLYDLYKAAQDNRLKEKYRTLLQETVLPVLDELLQCVQEQYGNETLQLLEKIIKENVHG